MGVMRFLALFILLFSVLIFQAAEARIRRYKWEVKYEYKSPDCFQKMVITINGQSPGPTILAEEGDTVIVELTNGLLTENVAIHWHGIRQVEQRFIYNVFFFLSLSGLNFAVLIVHLLDYRLGRHGLMERKA